MDKEIKEILFMTAFPNRDEDSFTILVYAKTYKDRYVLIWSPKAKKLNCEINTEFSSWQINRTIEINGSVYTTDEGYLLKIIDLDYKRKISKSDIEKMFGCEVIDK